MQRLLFVFSGVRFGNQWPRLQVWGFSVSIQELCVNIVALEIKVQWIGFKAGMSCAGSGLIVWFRIDGLSFQVFVH